MAQQATGAEFAIQVQQGSTIKEIKKSFQARVKFFPVLFINYDTF